ncbi:hypothetical protein HanRHA438_Chr10g0469961 [Helianthus annuus]|nr:hypothetical protein HanRHA438_Chr10g0469961 [Helianthus annuus]
MEEYVVDDPKYSETTFTGRYHKIVGDIQAKYEWSQEGLEKEYYGDTKMHIYY